MAEPVAPTGASGPAAVAARYRWAGVRRRARGRLGADRGHGAGGALEFLDFRDYVPGDDVRHVDWRGFARHEHLRVRQFEIDVAPHVDLVVDDSASLASTPQKAAAAQALLAAFAVWAQRDGAVLRVHRLGGERVDPASITFAAPATAPRPPHGPLRAGGRRVLLSDCLWPESPRPLLHALLGGAVQCVVLQLLDPWELAPTPGEATTLVDCETGERTDRLLDAAWCAGYRERLQRLCDDVHTTVVGGGGLHVLLPAAELATMCADTLLPAGVLEPA